MVYGAGESQLLPLMDENVARFPMLKLFSLPSFMADGGRRIELGVKGDPAHVDAAIAHLARGWRRGPAYRDCEARRWFDARALATADSPAMIGAGYVRLQSADVDEDSRDRASAASCTAC